MSNTLGNSLLNHSLCRTNVVEGQSRVNSGNYLGVQATLPLKKSLIPVKFRENIILKKERHCRGLKQMVSVVPRAVLATDPGTGVSLLFGFACFIGYEVVFATAISCFGVVY
ncbi:alpha-glucan, water dikinase [Ranunculus cassubicifolius]